jgi:putative tricarboxylic transport membrane protein
MSDRLTGLVLLVVSAWYGYLAFNIKNSFFSDPLGSRAFPIVVASLLVPLAVLLIVRQPKPVVWPRRASYPPLLYATGLFIGYAYLLPWLGFALANTLIFAGIAMIFGAQLRQATLAAVVASGVLYLIFSVALDLYLPTGRLLEGWFG